MAEVYESNNASILQYMFRPGSAMFYDSEGKTLINELDDLPADDIYKRKYRERHKPFPWRSRDLLRFVKQALGTDIPLTLEAEDSIFIGQSIVAKSGKKYVAVRRFPLKMFNRHKFFFQKLGSKTIGGHQKLFTFKFKSIRLYQNLISLIFKGRNGG